MAIEQTEAAPTKTRLTDRAVASLKPGQGRIERFDAVVPGLAIRVNNGGSKSWTLHYRVGRRKLRWTIGPYPAITLGSARKKALVARGMLFDKGTDPSAAKRAARTAETFGDLAKSYERARSGKRSWSEDARMLNKILLPAWKHRRLTEIGRRDVRAILDPIIAAGHPVAANRVQALISVVFNFAVREELIVANPAARIDKQPETGRDRVLTDDELRALWVVLEPPIDAPNSGARAPARVINRMVAIGLQVLLLTAQRSGEVFRMRWQDVDMKEGWWTIPAQHSKNRDPHRVPLTSRVVELLRGAKAEGPADNPWVFAGIKGAHVAARAVKAMAVLRRTNAIEFDCHRHDFRRTAATNMAKAGIPRDTIAKVLNHVDRGSRMTQIYDRFNYDSAKRAALESWDRHFSAILAAKESQRVLQYCR